MGEKKFLDLLATGLAGVLFFAGLGWGQAFPMRYLGELGKLGAGARVGPALGVAEGVVRLEGKGWRVTLGVDVGLGWAELYTADFDGDGQADYLIGVHRPVLIGRCTSATRVTVITFDKAGLPVPMQFETELPRGPGFANASYPFLPVWVVDRDRDGRAEFESSDCEGGKRVFRAGAEVLTGGTDGMVEELTEEGIVIGGKRSEGWPSQVIRDGVGMREIAMADGRDPLLDAMRNGFPVRRLADPSWLYVDGRRAGARANVRVRFVVTARTANPLRAVGCGATTYGEWWLRRCAGRWERRRGGTVEELLADGVTVRTSHTAMQHTVTGETRYARPPGAGRMTGMVRLGEFELTQWGPGLFALHAEDGRLVASRVELDVAGYLFLVEDGLVF